MFNLGHASYNCSPDGAIFSATVNVGKYTSIAQNCMFLGKGAHLSVVFRNYVSNYPFKEREYSGNFPVSNENGMIEIGNDVWIGFRATILNNIKIGSGAIIGAGTLVSKDVPPYSVFLGNPGKVDHYRFTPDQIEKMLEIAWWDWDDKTVRERVNDFNDINSFIQKYG